MFLWSKFLPDVVWKWGKCLSVKNNFVSWIAFFQNVNSETYKLLKRISFNCLFKTGEIEVLAIFCLNIYNYNTDDCMAPKAIKRGIPIFAVSWVVREISGWLQHFFFHTDTIDFLILWDDKKKYVKLCKPNYSLWRDEMVGSAVGH